MVNELIQAARAAGIKPLESPPAVFALGTGVPLAMLERFAAEVTKPPFGFKLLCVPVDWNAHPESWAWPRTPETGADLSGAERKTS